MRTCLGWVTHLFLNLNFDLPNTPERWFIMIYYSRVLLNYSIAKAGQLFSVCGNDKNETQSLIIRFGRAWMKLIIMNLFHYERFSPLSLLLC